MTQKQYKFSLSIRDKHHRTVKKIVDGLLEKGNGALSQSIRDGLRLINDLRRGNVTVLLEMFPDIVEKLCTPTPPSTDDIKELKRELEDFRREFRERQNTQNHEIPDTRSYGIPAMKQAGQGIGKLANRVIQMPTFDEDEPDDGATIVLTPGKAIDNGANLLNGMFGVMG